MTLRQKAHLYDYMREVAKANGFDSLTAAIVAGAKWRERQRIDSEPTEESCPGHIASAHDPKVCGRCGVHVNSLRPDEGVQP